MLANVTMTAGDRRNGGNHISDIRNEKEESLDIKKFESAFAASGRAAVLVLAGMLFAGVGE